MMFAAPEQLAYGRGSLTFGGAISSPKAVTLPVQSVRHLEVPVPEMIMVMHVIASRSASPSTRSVRFARSRSAVEGIADIDHLQLDGCF
jgi:hypothetical protein